MVKSYYILTSLFIFIRAGFCQEIDYQSFSGTKVKSIVNSHLDKPYFKQYGLPSVDQYILINSSPNTKYEDNPEEVLWRVYNFSETEKATTTFMDNGLSIRSYIKNKTIADTLKNFLVLRHKLTLQLPDGDELAIIKYSEFADSSFIQNYSIQILTGKNQSRITKQHTYDEIEYVIKNIETKEFWSLIKKGELDENDLFIPPAILDKVKDKSRVLNLAALAEIMRDREKAGKTGLMD